MIPPTTNICTVPTEMIQEIFQWAIIPSPFTDAGSTQLQTFDTTAMTLSHVCGVWRNMALSCPKFWATMAIRYPTTSGSCLDLVKLYLRRSGKETPLVLHLKQGGAAHWGDERDEVQATDIIFGLWLGHVKRWQSFDFEIHVEEGPPSRLLVDTTEEDFQNIQHAHLQLGSRCKPPSETIQAFWDKILKSPKLRTAFWPQGTDFPALELQPYSQLTGLTLRIVTLGKILSVLPLCSSLTELSVQELCWGVGRRDQGPAGDQDLINLPFLKLLSVRSNIRMDEFLDQLSVPTLNELRLSHLTPLANPLALKRFLEKSDCSLKRLYLQTQEWNESTHLDYLVKASDHLQDLEFCNIRAPTAFSREALAVILLQGAEVPFPNLLRLKFYSCCATNEEVREALTARRGLGKPLDLFSYDQSMTGALGVKRSKADSDVTGDAS